MLIRKTKQNSSFDFTIKNAVFLDVFLWHPLEESADQIGKKLVKSGNSPFLLRNEMDQDTYIPESRVTLNKSNAHILVSCKKGLTISRKGLTTWLVKFESGPIRRQKFFFFLQNIVCTNRNMCFTLVQFTLIMYYASDKSWYVSRSVFVSIR